MPVIKKPNQHFDINLYTGNSTTNVITNSGSMQPDFVWIKSRSNAQNNDLFDSVRGAGYALFSNATNAETNNTANFTSFNSNGFSLASNGGDTNLSGYTYVGWQWKAGGTAVTNTAGSITSQVSANPTAGFSVVTYTGTGANATVGHGLGVAPSMVIVKRRPTTGSNWPVWHIGIANTEYLMLNSTNAKTTGLAWWNSTSPTSTVFSVGSDPDTNGTVAIVAYCFAPVAGYSAFGSYTGNGSANGPFVYTGFRPKFFMWKRSNTSGNSWLIVDTSRSPTNTAGLYLQPDNTGTEGGGATMDLLSNGMKIQGDTTASTNGSGDTYIYMAFAEAPFKFANAR